MTTKYLFFTGGVVSSVGKGVTAAAMGLLLKERGFKVAGVRAPGKGFLSKSALCGASEHVAQRCAADLGQRPASKQGLRARRMRLFGRDAL